MIHVDYSKNSRNDNILLIKEPKGTGEYFDLYYKSDKEWSFLFHL
jgi:hypothetical protein